MIKKVSKDKKEKSDEAKSINWTMLIELIKV